MSAVTILEQARKLIEDPNHWCTDHYARNAKGNHVDTLSPNAVQFCAKGSLYRILQRDISGGTKADDLIDQAARDLFDTVAVDVNDKLGHAAVLRMYDRAIELANEGKQHVRI